MAFTTVPVEDFVVEQGDEAIGIVRATPFGERQFCTRCGTSLTIRVDFQPETIDVTVATLDAPDTVAPGFHIFCDSAIAWAPINDGLPRHAGFRPETRGLPAAGR